MAPACSFNAFDSKVARNTETNISIIRAARELYSQKNPYYKFDSEESYDVLKAFIAKYNANDMKSFIKLVLGGDTSISEQNAMQVLNKSYSMKQIGWLCDAIKNIYYTVFEKKMEKDSSGHYKDEWTQQVVDEYKSKHDSIEPSVEYIFRNQNYKEVNEYIRNYIIDQLEQGNLRDRGLLQSILKDKLNFALLIWKTKDIMYQDCGIKFGKKSNIVLDFNDLGELEDVDLEESVKDNWMREKDKENPLNDIATSVNIYLSRLVDCSYTRDKYGNKIRVVNDGKAEYSKDIKGDHFGFVKRVNVSSISTDLLTILTGCTTQAEMLEVLREDTTDSAILDKIKKDLNTDTPEGRELVNAFFRSFCTKTEANMLSVTSRENISEEEVTDPTTGEHSKKLLKRLNIYFNKHVKGRGKVNSYIYLKSSGKVAENSIFKSTDKGNVINGDNWLKFKEAVESFIVYNESTNSAELLLDKDLIDNGTFTEIGLKRDILRTLLKYLDINLQDKDIDILGQDARALETVLSNIASLSKSSNADENTSVATFLKQKLNRQNLEGIFRGLNEGLTRRVRMIRIGDSSYSTHVMSNKISKDFNKILHYKRLAEIVLTSNNAEYINRTLYNICDSLKAYLQEEYLNSKEYLYPYGEKEHLITSDWIRELMNTKPEDFSNPDSFINNFKQNRIMSDNNKGTVTMSDEMSAGKVLETLIKSFIITKKDSGKNKSGNALYCSIPLFTSGDSNTLRTVTTKYYSTIEDIARQIAYLAVGEMSRMELQARAKETFEAKGKASEVKGITADADKSSKLEDILTGNFSMLTFLNEYKDDLRIAAKNNKFVDMVMAIVQGKPFEFTDATSGEVFSRDYGEANEDGIEGGALYKFYIKDFWNNVKDLHTFKNTNNGGYLYAFGNNIKAPTANNNSNELLMFFGNSIIGYCNQFMFTRYNPTYAGFDKNGSYSKQLLKQSVSLQKRNKANYTPGIFCNVDALDYDGNHYARVVDGKIQPEKVFYFKEHVRSLTESWTDAKGNVHEGNQELYDFIIESAKEHGYSDEDAKELADAYSGINSSDGQGFRTLSSYRRVRGMTAKWTREEESAYRKVDALRTSARERAAKKLGVDVNSYEARMAARFTAKEIDELNEIGLVLQPFKPHLSSHEKVKVGQDSNNSQILNVPVEHKYAEVVLIPEIFGETSKYKEIAVAMEMNDVDVSMSEECVKVGMYGSSKIYDDSKGVAPSVREAMQDAENNSLMHYVDYSDLTIQIEVPLHSNTQQLIGTQQRKHMIDALLEHNTDYEGYDLFSGVLGGQRITEFNIGSKHYDLTGKSSQGRKVALKLYNALVSAGFKHSAEELGKILDDKKKLSDTITTLKSNDRDAGFYATSQYALNEDESDFENPIYDPLTLYDTESVLMSLFKKRVLKQHILGGSAVQFSDEGLGYDLKTVIKTNDQNQKYIDYTECAMTWDFKYTDVNGKEHDLKYSDYVDDNGDLIMLDSEGNELSSEDRDKGVQTKVEKEFPGILDVITYRIPTERDYSITNSKAMHFVPKIMGGVIANPYYYIKRAGWDYDIDKQYWFRREFREAVNKYKRRNAKDLSPSTIKKIWFSDIYGLSYKSKKEKDSLKRNITKNYVDISKATPIYVRLVQARKEAIERKKEETRKRIEQQNIPASQGLFDNNAEALSKLQALVNYEEEVETEGTLDSDEELVENIVLHSRLLDYWDEAGLSKPKEEGGLGMSASAYFDSVLNKNADEEKAKLISRWECADLNNFDPYELSNVARNNLLIDFIQSRLRDPQTAMASWVFGGFEECIRSSKILKALINPSNTRTYEEILKDPGDEDIIYSPVNPYSTAVYNARNRIAKQIIAIAANHSANMVFSQALSHMALTNGHEIDIFGHHYSDMLGKERIPSINSKGIINDNYIVINNAMHYIAEALASSVDAVKNPVLNFLNINKATVNTAMLMFRLGINSLQVGLFLNQPSIKAVCNRMDEYGGSNLHNAIMKVLKDNYGAKSLEQVVDHNFTEKELADMIINHRKAVLRGDKDASLLDKRNQILILSLFDQISKAGNALNTFIKRTKFTAANSIDNTAGSIISHTMNIEQADASDIDEYFSIIYDSDVQYDKNKEISSDSAIRKGLDITAENYKEKLTETPLAIEQSMYDLVKYFVNKLSNNFPYKSKLYKTIYEIVKDRHYINDLNPTLINTINYAIPLFIMEHVIDSKSRGTISLINPDETNYADSDFTNRQYYTKKFPQELSEVLSIRKNMQELEEALTEDTSDEEYDKIMDTLDSMFDSLSEKYSWFNMDYNTFMYHNTFLDSLEVEEVDIEPTIPRIMGDKNFDLKYAKVFNIGLTDNIQFDKGQQKELGADWETLFLNSTDKSNNIAVNLMLYNIHNSGFNPNSHNFAILSTPSLRAACPIFRKANGDTISYNNVIRSIGNNNSIYSDFSKDFLNLLYMNNANNGNIVKQFYSIDYSKLEGRNRDNSIEGFPVHLYKDGVLTLNISNNSDCSNILIATNNKEISKILPCFTVHSTNIDEADRLFIRVGEGKYHKGTSMQVKYVEVPIRNGNDYSQVTNTRENLLPPTNNLIIDVDVYNNESGSTQTEIDKAKDKKYKQEAEEEKEKQQICTGKSGENPNL